MHWELTEPKNYHIIHEPSACKVIKFNCKSGSQIDNTMGLYHRFCDIKPKLGDIFTRGAANIISKHMLLKLTLNLKQTRLIF